jgi:hypothetical protein
MNSQETNTTPAVDIKDYLLDKSPGDYAMASGPYQVLLQTASDFIISRKKGRIEKELVVLISEGLFYFKEKDKIEKVTTERLQTFLRDLRGLCITLEQVLWLPKLNKDGIHRLMDIITNPTLIEMAGAKVLTEDANTYDSWRTEYWKKNPELYVNAHAALSGISQSHYQTGMEAAFEVYGRYGYDEAMYFVDALGKSNFEQFSLNASRYSYSYSNKQKGFFQLLDKPYNLELRRLIDYTFIDSFAQGITKINSDFWQAYENYLKMQIQAFGEIKDKYPRYLMTAHDVTALNIGLLERITSDEDFADLTAEVRSLAHEDNEYSIIVPATARQIAEEGIALSHCMGSNAEQIASGDLQVLFLRNSNAKEKPLVTLRYSNDKITGAEGLHRRGLTADERKFLEGWGKEKDVQIAA